MARGQALDSVHDPPTILLDIPLLESLPLVEGLNSARRANNAADSPRNNRWHASRVTSTIFSHERRNRARKSRDLRVQKPRMRKSAFISRFLAPASSSPFSCNSAQPAAHVTANLYSVDSLHHRNVSDRRCIEGHRMCDSIVPVLRAPIRSSRSTSLVLHAGRDITRIVRGEYSERKYSRSRGGDFHGLG